MCLLLPVGYEAVFGLDGEVHAVKVKEDKMANKANKILMQCGGDQCEVTKQILYNSGRPEGWFAVDVEGVLDDKGSPTKISMVLCPGCFSALGIKVPTVTVTP